MMTRRLNYQSSLRWFVALCGIALVTLMWSGGLAAVSAQGDEGENTGAEEDAGHIVSFDTEILYPVVIRFFVYIDLPPEAIGSVSLTVRQESGLQMTFPVSVSDHVRDAGVNELTLLVYNWMLVEHEAPKPFESLNFSWQVEGPDDQISVVADEFLLEDTIHGRWYQAGAPPLTLHWHNRDLGGRRIQNEVLAAYDLLSRHTGLRPRFEFAIYDPGVRLCDTTTTDTERTVSVVKSRYGEDVYPCSRQDFEQRYTEGGVLFLQRSSLGYSELRDELVMAMADQFYTQFWQGAEVPAWFAEGLARLYLLQPDYAALQSVRAAARSDALLDLRALTERPADDAGFQIRVFWSAQSYLLVMFLADQYGAMAPVELAQSVPETGGGFDAALRSLLGDDYAGLWADWTRWLFSDRAESALNWTPYLPPTPTPTTTPTASSVPPTRTPTATPTLTLTATSTFVAEQPPTPVVVQITPSATLRPTRVPLPAGSLPTVTPHSTVPATGSDGGSDLDTTSAGLLVALGAGGLLLVTLLMWGVMRRR